MDPGAIGPDGVMEKDITLAIALQLRDLLRKKSGCEVFLTRDTDGFVTARRPDENGEQAEGGPFHQHPCQCHAGRRRKGRRRQGV